MAKKLFENSGFDTLAQNPTLTQLAARFKADYQRREEERVAREEEKRERIEAARRSLLQPALDLRAKYHLPLVKIKGV